MYELSGDEARGGWIAEDNPWSAALDLSLVFSEGGPRSTVREEGEMNREDIIGMAREAGLCIDGEVAFSPNHNGADVDINDLQTFAALVAAAEREACAKVCDELVLEHPGRADLTAKQCAFAIRERGAP